MNHSARRDARLAQSLRTLAEIEATSATPARVEAAVIARWDTEHDPHQEGRDSLFRPRKPETDAACIQAAD